MLFALLFWTFDVAAALVNFLFFSVVQIATALFQALATVLPSLANFLLDVFIFFGEWSVWFLDVFFSFCLYQLSQLAYYSVQILMWVLQGFGALLLTIWDIGCNFFFPGVAQLIIALTHYFWQFSRFLVQCLWTCCTPLVIWTLVVGTIGIYIGKIFMESNRTSHQTSPQISEFVLDRRREKDVIDLTKDEEPSHVNSGPILESKKVPPSSPKIDDDKLCVICMDGEKQMIILPCGHLCLCTKPECSERLKECPLCREAVSSVKRVYM